MSDSASRRSERAASISGRLGRLNLNDLTAPAEDKHPLAGPGFGFENPENYLLLDPRKIVLEGPYVRVWFEDAEFAAFREAVRQNGDIGQPLGIRTAGKGIARRYILAYGMRRWRAALDAGLEKVPVRDYGELTEEASVRLQMIENEARADPHPVDTAYGYYLLIAGGMPQVEAARANGRDKGYVSIMRAVGEAIAQLDAAARARLYTSPRVSVRAFQELAKIRDLEARRDALLALAADEETPMGRTVRERLGRERAPFQARTMRNGRSFRVVWHDEDLRADPVAFTEGLLTHLLREQEALAARLRELEQRQRRRSRKDGAAEADPAALATAGERLARVIEQVRASLAPEEE